MCGCVYCALGICLPTVAGMCVCVWWSERERWVRLVGAVVAQLAVDCYSDIKGQLIVEWQKEWSLSISVFISVSLSSSLSFSDYQSLLSLTPTHISPVSTSMPRKAHNLEFKTSDYKEKSFSYSEKEIPTQEGVLNSKFGKQWHVNMAAHASQRSTKHHFTTIYLRSVSIDI